MSYAETMQRIENIKAFRESVAPLREKLQENFNEIDRLYAWGGMSGPIAKLLKRNSAIIQEIKLMHERAGF